MYLYTITSIGTTYLASGTSNIMLSSLLTNVSCHKCSVGRRRVYVIMDTTLCEGIRKTSELENKRFEFCHEGGGDAASAYESASRLRLFTHRLNARSIQNTVPPHTA